MIRAGFRVAAAAAVALPAVVSAQEVFVGVYDHGVDTPFTLFTGESGTDVAVGVRFGRIRALRAIGAPQPYLVASANLRGDTSFAGGGLSWTIGKGRIFVRPGIGLVVHDGPGFRVDLASGYRTDLGSRVLFEPEIALGYRLSNDVAVEASWMHISQGRIFNSQQNPGIDMIGARLDFSL